MFWRRRENEPEEFDFEFDGPCLHCGHQMKVMMPWFRSKKVYIKCVACQTGQEIYPNRMAYTDTVKNGRDTK